MISLSKLTCSIIFLLVAGTITGPAVYFFKEPLQFFRIIIIVSLFFLYYLLKNKKISIPLEFKVVLYWFGFYLAYTMLANIISIMFFDISELKINSIINFNIIFLLVSLLIYFASYDTSLFVKTLYKSINFMIIVLFFVSLWEILTQHHLPTATFFNFAPKYIQFMTATFYTNPNDYLAMLTLMNIFIISYRKIYKLEINIWIVVIVLISLVLSFVVNARLAMIVIVLTLLLTFINKKNILKLTFASVFLAAISMVIFSYINTKNLDYLLSGLEFGGDSTHIRTYLYVDAFESIESNYGLGFGVDNSADYYTSINDPRVEGIINPHNYVLEILLNSGLPVILFFIIMNLILVYIFLRNKNYILLYALMSYYIILLSSSSSIFLWFHYVYLIGIISLYLESKRLDKKGKV